MAYRLVQAVAVSLAATCCVATQFMTEETLPEGTLSEGCANALIANISCPYQVATFPQDRYYPVDSLKDACTSSCSEGLAAYEKDVSSSCGKADVYRNSETGTAPASLIPSRYRYAYNKTCIQDGERWCHIFAQDMLEGGKDEDRCDNCVIKQYQFVAGAANAGQQLRDDYTSLTKSCSKTGFPLAPTSSMSVPVSSTPGSATPTPTSGSCRKTYTIKEGDTCQSISKSQGIGTAQLLLDNGLDAYCNNFPTSGNLCVKSTCTTYTVGANETCRDIGRKYLLTTVQLAGWNPILGKNCRHIDRSVGNSICVSPPGYDDWTPITIPSTTASTTGSATAAPVPTDIANGTVERCAEYYLVEKGDFCNKILLKYSISLEDFLFLNKGVNQNCTNLYANETYCVAPVGSIDQYPGAPGYITPGESYSDVPFTDYPKATYTPPANGNETTTLLPMAPGTRRDCYAYVGGPNLQIDVSGTFYTSTCEAVAEAWSKTLEELTSWNPSLDANGTCTFDTKYRYCMDPYKPTDTEGSAPTTAPPSTSSPAPSTTPPPTGTTSTSAATTTTSGGAPGPTQSGIPDNCNKWHLVESEDENCYSVAQEYDITLDQFYKWNPAVENDCADGFWKGNAYCVGVAA